MLNEKKRGNSFCVNQTRLYLNARRAVELNVRRPFDAFEWRTRRTSDQRPEVWRRERDVETDGRSDRLCRKCGRRVRDPRRPRLEDKSMRIHLWWGRKRKKERKKEWMKETKKETKKQRNKETKKQRNKETKPDTRHPCLGRLWAEVPILLGCRVAWKYRQKLPHFS